MLGLTKFFHKAETQAPLSEWDTVKSRLRQIPEALASHNFRTQSNEERARDQRVLSQTTVQGCEDSRRVFYAGTERCNSVQTKKCSIVPEVSRAERLWDRKIRP